MCNADSLWTTLTKLAPKVCVLSIILFHFTDDDRIMGSNPLMMGYEGGLETYC